MTRREELRRLRIERQGCDPEDPPEDDDLEEEEEEAADYEPEYDDRTGAERYGDWP